MSPETTCQGVINMLMNPGPYWPLYFGGFHLPVGEGQRTALCQGGVLAARSIGPKVTRLVRCGSGETKDKNFSKSTVAPRTLAPFAEEWTHLLEHTRCRCFSQELFDRASCRDGNLT